MEALVNKIIPFSSVDGPGNRTAIFLQGCNFSCLYCHNPETIQLCRACGICVDKCPTGALCLENGQVRYDSALCVYCDTCFKSCPHSASPRVRSMTPRQVMEEVSRNQPFIRGITVSGGECTRQRDFLVEFLTLAGQAGLDTLLDSNGSYDFSADPELMSVTGGVMLDVKEVLIPTKGVKSAVITSGKYLYDQTYMLLYGLYQIVSGKIPLKDLHGIIAITKVGGDIIDNSGIFSGLLLIAIISLDLAIVNFLPIPALDGGHVLFLIIEKLRGKPLEEETIDKIGTAGFMFLILLMIFVIFNDIFALITKQL